MRGDGIAGRPAVVAWIALVLVGVLAGVTPAQAQSTIEAGCMQDLAGFNLNCTANDVQVASATNINILDDGCAFPGDTVTFEATFEVVLTAQARHDIGIYFAIDGDSNGNGAVSGTCSVSTVAYLPDPPNLDLDGTTNGGFCENDPRRACLSNRDCRAVRGACALRQDTCGDIDGVHNPLFPVIEITTACIDHDGDGKLNLPNCTSWRQPGANQLCLAPDDAFPGAPSKCRCDLGFNVDIDVPSVSLTVAKTPNPTSVDEPGALVNFSVSVRNDSPYASFTLDTLEDDVFGDITTVHGDVESTTCSLPRTLAHGATYSCSFTAWVSGNGDTSHRDEVTASGQDQFGNPVSGSDDAVVAINDLLPTILVAKTATPTEVLEPGANVTFAVTVRNTSAVDAVTIDTLLDDVHGDLNGRGSCSVPRTIAPGGSYNCSFTAFVGGAPGDVELDLVTAGGSDDEGNSTSASDSATVNINDARSSIELIKTASPSSVPEPGGMVTFNFLVRNTSTADAVTISSLVDSIYGNLNGQGDCSVPQTIAHGGSYSCSFTVFVGGNAFSSETNVATVTGLDDDGDPVNDDDDATVNVADVAPGASLHKTPTQAVVTFEVTVFNYSTADELALGSLVDDTFGDITSVHDSIQSTTCAVPQILAKSGQAGDSYSCSFRATVSSSPHVDTVTGTLTDDEGNSVQPSDNAEVTF